jgi:hypothetical protein
MAHDYLPIQGLSTPSEHAFLNASLTNSKQHNWLAPNMFKVLQILKSGYHHGHMTAPAEAELDHMMKSILRDQGADIDNILTSFL